MRPGAARLRLIVALLLAAMALAYAWRKGRGMPGIDFYQFWAGAQVARQTPVRNIYAPDVRREAAVQFLRRAQTTERSEEMLVAAQLRPEFEFFSTPFLYATFGAFPGRYNADHLAYRVVLFAAFIAGVMLIGRAAGLSWEAILLLLAFLLTLFEPLESEVRVSNVNAIQFLAVAAAIFVGRRFPAAFILGALVAFKPNVLVVLPTLALYRGVRRDFRTLRVEVAGAAAGAAASVIAGALYFRSWRSWLEWAAAAKQLAGSHLPLSLGNVSPTLGLVTEFGPGAAMVVAALLLGVLGFALAGSGMDDETPLLIGFGLVVYLCTATLVWLHYLVLALPLAIVLLGNRSSKAQRAVTVAALTFLGWDVWSFILGAMTYQTQARLFAIGLAMLIAVALWRLMSRPAESPQPRRRRRS